MSNDIRVFGVKLILDDKDAPVSPDATIGLYNVTSAASEFRWLQNDVTGVSTWATGMIVANGIGKWKRSIDTRKGGNVAAPITGSVKIKNTALFYNELKTRGISLPGLVCEIWEFVNGTPTRRLFGKVETVDWDVTDFTINIRGGINDRRANITQQTTDNLVIPVHFGNHYPELNNDNSISINSFAKLIRSSNQTNRIQLSNESSITGLQPSDLKQYCIAAYYYDIAGLESPSIVVEIGTIASSIDINALNTLLTGKYIRVISDSTNSENTGQIRKILSVDTTVGHFNLGDGSALAAYITLNLSSYFSKDLTIESWIAIE
jgi:hypothetical protein